MSPGPQVPGRSRVPAGRLLWSLVDDAEVVDRTGDGQGGGLSVVGSGRRLDVADPSPTVRDVLWRMGLGPVALQNVAGLQESFASWTSGGTDCGPWHEVKAVLDRLGGFVVLSLADPESTDLVVSVSLVEGAPDPPGFAVPEVDPRQRQRLLPSVRLSRPGCGPASLTYPAGPLRVDLHGPAALAVASELAAGARSAVELVGTGRDLSAVLDVLAFLAGAGMIAPTPEA